MKTTFLYIMAALYVIAGINHFWHPGFYIKMVRNFLPYPVGIVYLSGVIEILLGIGLMIPATQKLSAWGVICLLIAIFPANIYMAIHPEQWNISTTAAYLRLPLQLVLIWLAYIYTK
jgi:uncharacterized membrane protein